MAGVGGGGAIGNIAKQKSIDKYMVGVTEKNKARKGSGGARSFILNGR